MRREDFLKEIGETFVAAGRLISAKNDDYAADDDAFLNFRKAAEIAGTDVATGILVRFGDKVTRLGNLIDRDPSVVGETVDDTILDAINYLAILRVWLSFQASAHYAQTTVDTINDFPSVNEEKTWGEKAADFLGGLLGKRGTENLEDYSMTGR